MKKILVIETSPNQDSEKGSLSQHILNEFLKEINFPHEVVRHNLDKEEYFKECLTVNNFAKFFDARSDELINELVEADAIIIATPTINFGVPAVLKNYFDKVLQASKTFKYKYDHGKGGSVGLLPPSKKAILINTQGSPKEWYPFTSVVSQIKGMLEFIGVNNLKTLVIDGTKTPEIGAISYSDLVRKHESDIKNLIKFIQ